MVKKLRFPFYATLLSAGAILCVAHSFAASSHSASSSHLSKTSSAYKASAPKKLLEESRRKKAALFATQLKQKQQIKQVEHQKQQAERQATQDKIKAQKAKTAATTATKTLEKTTTTLSELESQIATTEEEKRRLETALDYNTQALAPFLPIIIRLSLYPDDMLLLAPLPPEKSVSALLALNSLSHYIEQLSKTIQEQKQGIINLENDLVSKKTELNRLKQQQSLQKTILDQKAIQAKKQEERSQMIAEQATKDVDTATRKASSLQEAITAIDKIQAEAQRQLQEEIERAKKNREKQKEMAARARAKSLEAGNGSGVSLNKKAVSSAKRDTAPNDDTAETKTAPGLNRHMAPSTPVKAPCNGHVDFSGPFRSYGNMVILNCGKSYRFILAGMGSILTQTGASISKNQTIGQMPSAASSLFIQLRHGQKIINPSPFL
ncbi:murein hydrolase activator EnvC family protein [Entomobacter blattae]|uniref:murein hydrolase activator EnvC family protein n=1 Tax=Entomobacter blattae TaxID=2762277 RepID=UPI00193B279B|nr:peptidoglycan DD-metalloendopeptidase family protein [Entomobacter blattae]